MITPRCHLFLHFAVALACMGPAALPAAPDDRAAFVRAEAQPVADRSDGTFRNPILAGHSHDPSVVRVGADYYLTHCPDLVIWLRIRNVDQDVALFSSADGRTWTKFPWGSEVSGNGVLRVALYATGGGEARFRRFTYHGL